jgi:hypothetical protein
MSHDLYEFKALTELMEFGKYKLAGGLVAKYRGVKDPGVAAGRQRSYTIYDPKSKTEVSIGPGSDVYNSVDAAGPSWSTSPRVNYGNNRAWHKLTKAEKRRHKQIGITNIGPLGPASALNSKEALQRGQSGVKVMRTLAKHAKHTEKRGRPVQYSARVINPGLAKVVAKYKKNKKYAQAVKGIETKSAVA